VGSGTAAWLHPPLVGPAYDQNYTFAQPAVQAVNGINCVVRRVYLAIIAKLSQNRAVQLVDYGC